MTSTPHDRTARTLGFNHVNLVVAHLDRSVACYRSGLGMVIENRTPEITFNALFGWWWADSAAALGVVTNAGPADYVLFVKCQRGRVRVR